MRLTPQVSQLFVLPLLSLALLCLPGCQPAPQPSQSSEQPRSHGGQEERPRGERARERERDRADRSDDARSDRGRSDGQARADRYEPADRGGRAPRARPRPGTPGNFDFYLLTLSWSPEFCATHPGRAECAMDPGFVLHGLWPQNTDATYPEHCSDAPGPANPGQYSDIFPDPSLLAHEWSTHGTCSGLGPDAYFQLARRAYRSVHTPPQLDALTQGTSEPPDVILSQFASLNPGVSRASLALSCGNNYLTAVQVCLAKDGSGTSCQIRTCAANNVRIVPRGGSGGE